MPEVELSVGSIDYLERGVSGPTIVFTHGLIMDASVWDPVIDELARDHRCIAPTLPLGAHRRPMKPGTNLSFRGISDILATFLTALDLRDVTLVVNDCGLPILTALDYPERIARLVLTPCEAFDNLPPGLPGKVAAFSVRLPGGVSIAARLLRVPLIRRLPLLFGWMAKHSIPDAVFRTWTEPALRDPRIRADIVAYAGDRNAKSDMRVTTQRLTSFDKPALVVWSAEDRVMPRDHGARLAALLPNARLVTVDDSYVLVQRDRPGALARVLREFVAESSK